MDRDTPPSAENTPSRLETHFPRNQGVFPPATQRAWDKTPD